MHLGRISPEDYAPHRPEAVVLSAPHDLWCPCRSCAEIDAEYQAAVAARRAEAPDDAAWVVWDGE